MIQVLFALSLLFITNDILFYSVALFIASLTFFYFIPNEPKVKDKITTEPKELNVEEFRHFIFDVNNYSKNNNLTFGKALVLKTEDLGYSVKYVEGTKCDPFHQTEHSYRFILSVFGNVKADEFLQTGIGKFLSDKYTKKLFTRIYA